MKRLLLAGILIVMTAGVCMADNWLSWENQARRSEDTWRRLEQQNRDNWQEINRSSEAREAEAANAAKFEELKAVMEEQTQKINELLKAKETAPN